MEGDGRFDALQRGIQRIKALMFQSRYLIDDAIKDAARAAYIATLLENM